MSVECLKVLHFDCCLHHVKSFANVICQRSFFMVIGIGQLLSILICGTAVTSGLLQEESVSIPTGQSFFSYVLLSATFTFWLFWSIGRKSVLGLIKDHGWKYFFLALLDVEANYLVVKAYQFTSVTSVQLLDCVTIPTVLILSRCLLHIRYLCSHLVGVVFCLIGATSLVLADHLTEKYQDGSSNLLGNVLVLSGAVLYGISNVGQELMVSRYGTLEYLGSYSFFACFISGTQFAILEREDVLAIKFCSRVVLYLVGFVVCLYLLMALMSYAMLKIGAMAVNLNLLSSDFFSLIVGIFVFRYKFHVLYFISFALIIVGLIIYNLRPPRSGDTRPPTETQEALDTIGADGRTADKTSDDLRLCSSGEACNTAIALETEQSTIISCNRNTFQSSSDIDETVALQCDQSAISKLNENNSLGESTDL